MPIKVSIDIDRHEPAISFFHRALHLSDTGELWVLPSEGLTDQPDGIMATYDIFDRQGNFQKQVSLACEGRGFDDCLFFAGNDRVVLVKGYSDALAAQFGRGTVARAEGEEPTLPELVYYRMIPSK